MHAMIAALFLALAVLVSESALARGPYGKVQGGGSGSFGKAQGGTQSGQPLSSHGHHRHGASFVGVGFGFAYPWYYPPPYYYPAYYYPQPVTYIEQGVPEEEPVGWWYYCESSTSYYPYAKECPDGWVRVPAEPPSD